jgi:23S rRNA (cytosine1962-C5)-methyltransferase
MPNVLNLFGYTGIATLAAAHAGAKVTHVDASKQSLDWAHENARLTGLPEDAVRWLPDDALAFVKREVRRGAKYEGIVLDPPAFGRGPKGEVWHIERDLPALLAACKELLAETGGSFFLLNGYAAGYAPRSLAEAVESVFGTIEGESGEMHIKESSSERVIPSGIYCRFVRE